MRDREIPILEALHLLSVYAYLIGVQLRSAHVTLLNALLLDPEWPINARNLLRTCGSYILVKIMPNGCNGGYIPYLLPCSLFFVHQTIENNLSILTRKVSNYLHLMRNIV